MQEFHKVLNMPQYGWIMFEEDVNMPEHVLIYDNRQGSE